MINENTNSSLRFSKSAGIDINNILCAQTNNKAFVEESTISINNIYNCVFNEAKNSLINFPKLEMNISVGFLSDYNPKYAFKYTKLNNYEYSAYTINNGQTLTFSNLKLGFVTKDITLKHSRVSFYKNLPINLNGHNLTFDLSSSRYDYILTDLNFINGYVKILRQ